MRILTASVLFALSAAAVMAQDGSIVARGKPGDAGLFVDGKYIGPASRFTVPEKYAIAPGEHEVSLKDPRYEDFTTKVTVVAKKKTKLKYSLKALALPNGPFGLLKLGGDGSESFISIAAGDTGAVMINDKFFGHVDEFNNVGSGILLPAGTYRLKLVGSQFSVDQDVTIEANKTTKVPLKK
ncbi:MAG: PEGA domain-containing protein [Acidobacteria bacterium]|nr:PEGA domain-containing protein [Acidobacteriota bacterium]